jgi:hypothetical protein
MTTNDRDVVVGVPLDPLPLLGQFLLVPKKSLLVVQPSWLSFEYICSDTPDNSLGMQRCWCYLRSACHAAGSQILKCQWCAVVGWSITQSHRSHSYLWLGIIWSLLIGAHSYVEDVYMITLFLCSKQLRCYIGKRFVASFSSWISQKLST